MVELAVVVTTMNEVCDDRADRRREPTEDRSARGGWYRLMTVKDKDDNRRGAYRFAAIIVLINIFPGRTVAWKYIHQDGPGRVWTEMPPGLAGPRSHGANADQ